VISWFRLKSCCIQTGSLLCRYAEGQKGTINKRAVTTVALLCGPPSLEEDTCMPALKALGYTDANIIRY
jgi:hypothetical protein